MDETAKREGERPDPMVRNARSGPTASSVPATDLFDEINRKLDLILEASRKEG